MDRRRAGRNDRPVCDKGSSDIVDRDGGKGPSGEVGTSRGRRYFGRKTLLV